MAGSVPSPPHDLVRRPLPISEIAEGTRLYRAHFSSAPPKHFGRSGRWRFDSPDRSYGVLYSGLSPEVAFAETLLRGGHFVAYEEIAVRSLCEFAARRSLRVVQLHGPGMRRIGATAGVTSGPDYAVSQEWSKTLFDHPAAIDGILYRATYDNDKFAAALFDRARDAIDGGRATPFASDLRLLGRILDHYGASTR